MDGSQPLAVRKMGLCLHTENWTQKVLSGNGFCIEIPCEESVNVACLSCRLTPRAEMMYCCALAEGSAGGGAGRAAGTRSAH